MMLGISLALTAQRSGDSAPPGFGFLMSGADRLTDSDGNFIIVESDVAYVELNAYLAALPALNIVGLGDSHLQGAEPVAADSATSVFGVKGDASPLDRMWNGTADAVTFIANSAINVTTGSTDSNIAVVVNKFSPLLLLPRLLRASYPMRCGVIRVANLAVSSSSSYSWGGELASMFTIAGGNANDGDTITLGAQAYTFRTVPSVANDVLIGATQNDTMRNLGRAVNLEGGVAGTDWGTGTAKNATVFCPSASSVAALKFCALVTGTAGNSIVIASSTTTRICVTQTGSPPVSSSTMVGGAAASALYTNAKVRLPGITPNIFLIALGTNDALRTGWRSQGYQVETLKLISAIATDYPAAWIILAKPCVPSGGSTVTSIVVPAIDALIAANPTRVVAIDMHTLGAGTGDVALRGVDGVHHTSYGYDVMNQLFAKQIASVLGW